MSDPDSHAGRDRPVAVVRREGIGRSPQANSGAYRILPAGDTAIVIEFGDLIRSKYQFTSPRARSSPESGPSGRDHRVRADISFADGPLRPSFPGNFDAHRAYHRIDAGLATLGDVWPGGGTCLCVTIGRLLPTSTKSRCAQNIASPGRRGS